MHMFKTIILFYDIWFWVLTGPDIQRVCESPNSNTTNFTSDFASTYSAEQLLEQKWPCVDFLFFWLCLNNWFDLVFNAGFPFMTSMLIYPGLELALQCTDLNMLEVNTWRPDIPKWLRYRTSNSKKVTGLNLAVRLVLLGSLTRPSVRL